MYETYWNLMEKPFRNFTDKKFFFYAETYEESYLRLSYMLMESQGLFLLTGEGGCGKSYLGKVFMHDMTAQGYRVAMLKSPSFAPAEFLQQIACGFGIDYAGKGRFEILHALQQMAERESGEKSCVLIIDDAHLVENAQMIEEIRLLLELEANSRPLFVVLLFGRPELADIIAKTSLKDRVAMQHRIAALNCPETGQYIYYRMNKAGGTREMFSADAVREIYAFSKGVPREINHICDMSLLLGYGESAIVVEGALVRKAIEDMKGGNSKPRPNHDIAKH